MPDKQTKAAIKRAQGDLKKLEKARSKYSGAHRKDVDNQIQTLRETISLYRKM